MAEESLITDEMRSMIGKEQEASTLELDKTTIRWFARAVGHTDLIFYDEDYAKSRGHRGIVAPPGFLGHAVYNPKDGPAASMPPSARLLGNKPRRVLNGGQEFEYYGVEICAGDVLKRVSKVTSIQERASSLGKMLIMVSESNFYNRDGKLVATQRYTGLIY